MNFQSGLITFIVGGTITTLISILELSNQRIWSGVAALVPVFTLVAYLTIGVSKNGVAVSQHAKFVLVGTIVAWIPYMLTIILFSPQIGPLRAVGLSLVVFSALCTTFVLVVNKMHLFV
jgi:uncharacterized membrane protein (GlpM family)